MSTPTRTRTLATLKELEADSGIDRTTLYRLCAPYGDLPCIRPTPATSTKRRTQGRIRVKWTDWDAWIERHRVAPPEASAPPATRAASSVLDLPGADRYSRSARQAS